MGVNNDIQTILDQFDPIESEVQSLVNDLIEETGTFRRNETGWSASECLDHLAVLNSLFLSGMEAAAETARRERFVRTAHACPSLPAKLFARFLEPPVGSVKVKTPPFTIPRQRTFNESYSTFLRLHGKLRFLLAESADLDLNRARFRFPLMTLMKVSLVDGFYVLAAHERRHMWQAKDVPRRATDLVPASALA